MESGQQSTLKTAATRDWHSTDNPSREAIEEFWRGDPAYPAPVDPEAPRFDVPEARENPVAAAQCPSILSSGIPHTPGAVREPLRRFLDEETLSPGRHEVLNDERDALLIQLMFAAKDLAQTVQRGFADPPVMGAVVRGLNDAALKMKSCRVLEIIGGLQHVVLRHGPLADKAVSDALKFAGELHDRIHEASALVECGTGKPCGWAPEDSIPLLAEGLLEFAGRVSAQKGGVR